MLMCFVFTKLFEDNNITSADDLKNLLRFEEWIPKDWNKWFPHLDLRKAINISYKFFFDDCKNNQQRNSVVAYNKIKHGLLVVPSGKQYVPNLPDCPAMVFHTSSDEPKSKDNPFTMLSFLNNDESHEERYRVVEFIQCNLRLYAALYVLWRYADILPQRGFKGPKELFESQPFVDVRHFIGETTAKI